MAEVLEAHILLAEKLHEAGEINGSRRFARHILYALSKERVGRGHISVLDLTDNRFKELTIDSAMTWDDTPEGYDFWSPINLHYGIFIPLD